MAPSWQGSHWQASNWQAGNWNGNGARPSVGWNESYWHRSQWFNQDWWTTQNVDIEEPTPDPHSSNGDDFVYPARRRSPFGQNPYPKPLLRNDRARIQEWIDLNGIESEEEQEMLVAYYCMML